MLNIDGIFFVADSKNHVVRKIDKSGSVTTFAGKTGQAGNIDVSEEAARFAGLFTLVADRSGNLYASDRHAIRIISFDDEVTTLAGSQYENEATNGGSGQARFNRPRRLATDPMGNLFVAGWGNHVIRKVDPDGWTTVYIADSSNHAIRTLDLQSSVSTLAGQEGSAGIGFGAMPAALYKPSGIAIVTSKLLAVTYGGSVLGLKLP